MIPTSPLSRYHHQRPLRPSALILPVRMTARRQAGRWMENVSLWLAMLMLLFVQPLYVEAAGPDHREGGGAGEFHFLTDAGHQPAPLLSTDYQVTVSGLIADTRLRQSFSNSSSEWREGVYVFPLPENASVYGMTMATGERVVIGEIQEREQAKKIYEQARDKGRQAARVDQQRPNLFTTRLANIPPGETVTVELRYQQLVTYDSGTFELRLPTTLTPRYIPGEPAPERATEWTGGWAMPTAKVPDADQVTPPTVTPGMLPEGSHQARVRVDLRGGVPVGEVTSPSHGLQDVRDNGRVRITPATGSARMDRDFVLRWQPVRGQEPSAAVFHEQWQGEDFMLALLVPGEGGSRALTRELVFVIDTSGSMAGESIRQARQALLRGLDTLGPQDRFNIIEFNSHTHRLFPQSVAASAGNLTRARRYIGSLQANGGTEMAPALAAALATAKEDAGADVRQVVFVTDGAVGNEQFLFANIRQQLGDSRLFTVGIGSAPNMHFMRQAARFGRGTYTAISDLGDVSGKLDGLFAKMQSPVLTEIETAWPDTAGPGDLPSRVGDLFQGEPLVLVAQGVAPKGELRVSGRLPGGEAWQRTLDLANAGPGVGIHRHWARQHIDHLLDQNLSGQVGELARAEITQLAIDHQLVTPYTSFVATDKAPARPEGAELHQAAVPTLLPAGSSEAMVAYPRTATPALLLMIAGVAGMTLTGIGACFRRRREGV